MTEQIGLLGQATLNGTCNIFAHFHPYETGEKQDFSELQEGEPLIILGFEGEEFLVLSSLGVVYVHESQVYLDFTPVFYDDFYD